MFLTNYFGRTLPVVLCVLAVGCLAARNVKGSPVSDPLTKSYELEAKGDLSGATQAMREAVEAAPDDYFPRLRVAYLELTSRDYRAAAADYERAARLDPKALEALLGWELALNCAELYAQAEAIGAKAIALDANNYLALSRLAWAKYKLGRLPQAASVYKKLLDAYPSDIEMRLGYGYCMLGTGNKPEAVAAFKSVLAMVPGHARAKAGLLASR